MREVPSETYQRITGMQWPGGRSETIKALLAIFGIGAAPGSAKANLELQKRILLSARRALRILRLSISQPESLGYIEGLPGITGMLEFEERLRADKLSYHWSTGEIATALVERERQLAEALIQIGRTNGK